MESLQKIKSRITAVKNIGQITKAMEMVAATKMRKSQEVMLTARPYAYTALDFLANLSKIENVKLSALLIKREIKKTALVIVSSDKGLVGSFNSLVFRAFENYLKKEKIDIKNPQFLFIAFGQKAGNYLIRKGIKVENIFTKFGDFTEPGQTKVMADYLIRGYLGNNWDRVLFFSPHFLSALRQQVFVRQVLPIEFENLKETIKELIPVEGKYSEFRKEEFKISSSGIIDYLIEPEPNRVLEELAPHLVEMQIYHLILEANTSKHAARRMAMKNATDNARQLTDDLTLDYNKSRQAIITREIIEIIAGAGK